MRRILLLLPLLVAGCVTGPNLESRMAAYIGASAETLVQGLGVPDKSITTNGVEYLAYTRHRSEIEPNIASYGFGGFGPYGGGFYGGGYYGGGFGGFGGFGALPSQIIDYSCETTFMLRNDRVVSFALRGNDCN